MILCCFTYANDDCLKQHPAHPHHQLGSARHRVFRFFKPRTLSGRQIISDHYPSLDSFQFSWSLFNHSQLDALSAACPSAFTAALRCLPTMPRELNVVHTDCARKPRQPTSTGNSQVCHLAVSLMPMTDIK